MANKYFTAVQSQIFINSILADQVFAVRYRTNSNTVPYYGYASKKFDAVLRGKYIVEGEILVYYNMIRYFWILMQGLASNLEGSLATTGGSVDTTTTTTANGGSGVPIWRFSGEGSVDTATTANGGSGVPIWRFSGEELAKVSQQSITRPLIEESPLPPRDTTTTGSIVLPDFVSVSNDGQYVSLTNNAGVVTKVLYWVYMVSPTSYNLKFGKKSTSFEIVDNSVVSTRQEYTPGFYQYIPRTSGADGGGGGGGGGGGLATVIPTQYFSDPSLLTPATGVIPPSGLPNLELGDPSLLTQSKVDSMDRLVISNSGDQVNFGSGISATQGYMNNSTYTGNPEISDVEISGPFDIRIQTGGLPDGKARMVAVLKDCFLTGKQQDFAMNDQILYTGYTFFSRSEF